jgi:hypothetical protein
MTEMVPPISDLVEARLRVDAMRASLPTSVDVRALGVVSKAPYKIMCIREALIWRNEELARTACDALEKDDLAVGIILTRATTENAALLWYLKDTLEKRKPGVGVDDARLMKMLVGVKSSPDMPSPIHVLDTLRHLDVLIPGVLKNYDYLSEFAHPNWHGVSLLYSEIDPPNFMTYFGKNLRGGNNKELTARLLVGSLGLFEHAYNSISDQMPGYLDELQKI